MTVRAVAGSSGGGITPGTTVISSGTDKCVLFDDAGVVAEDVDLKWNKTTNTLSVGIVSFPQGNTLTDRNASGVQFSGNCTVNGSYSAGADEAGILTGGSGNGLQLKSTMIAGWGSGSTYASPDAAWGRNAAGVIEANNGTLGTFRDVKARSFIAPDAASTIGYATGSGGAVTQLTSRTTGVTLNKINGAITLFNAAGSATAASFTVTNSTVAATDTIILSVKSGTNKYLTFVTAVAAGSFEITFQTTGGTAADSPVINFAVIKAVAA